jgi:2-polyprenyl-3-methyl-5-hydroxy-6-metoxy-1,4-benzoquinol methylase
MTEGDQVRTAPFETDMKDRGFLQPKSWSKGSYNPRFRIISEHVEGKLVLDLGCSSGNWRNDWVHGQIASVASHAVGLDINEVAAGELRDRGFDIQFGNAEAFDLERTFEVIHAGELIEHLEKPGSMLESVRRHLADDGLLIITTPNPFAISNFIYRLRGRPRVNGDHVAWFCEDTLGQLLNRVGFDVRSCDYLKHETPGKFRRAIALMVRAPLPDRLAWGTLVVMATPKTP